MLNETFSMIFKHCELYASKKGGKPTSLQFIFWQTSCFTYSQRRKKVRRSFLFISVFVKTLIWQNVANSRSQRAFDLLEKSQRLWHCLWLGTGFLDRNQACFHHLGVGQYGLGSDYLYYGLQNLQKCSVSCEQDSRWTSIQSEYTKPIGQYTCLDHKGIFASFSNISTLMSLCLWNKFENWSWLSSDI